MLTCAEEHHFLGSRVELVSFLSNVPQIPAPSRRRLVWPSAQSSLSCGTSAVYYSLPCSTEFHFRGYCSLHTHGPAQSRILLCHLTTTPGLRQRTKREEALEPHTSCRAQKPHSIQHQPVVYGPAVWTAPPPLSLPRSSSIFPPHRLLEVQPYWPLDKSRKHSVSLRDRTIMSHSSMKNTRKIFSHAECNPQEA